MPVLDDAAWSAVGAWMDEQGLPGGAIAGVEELAGGTQNVVVRFERGGVAYVLRRGPQHLRPASNDAMRREMRVLAALTSTAVPHPPLVAACPDGAPLGGAAFYLMEPVDGFTATAELPEPAASDPSIRRALTLAAVDAAAALHAVDHEAVGLDDFGKPEGYLERQVPRWMRELEGYAEHAGWPGPQLPGLDRVVTWLDANRPGGFRPAITHGDFHLSNLLYRPTGEVAAVVDWEMCTIGDPLVDIGWLLATWPPPVPGGTTLLTAGGLATRGELVARYAEGTGRDVSAVSWYEVLACFRLGIILEGTYARSCAGKAPKDVGASLHEWAVGLFEHATAVMAAP